MKRTWLAVRDTGDPALTDALRLAVDDFRRVGRLATPHLLSLLVDAYLAVGRLDDAATALDEAFDARGEERFFDVELLRQRAAIVRARAVRDRSTRASLEPAERHLEQATELALAQGSRLLGLRATVDPCRLWIDTGRRDPARQRLIAALADVAEGTAEPDVVAARALLDTLARPIRRAANRATRTR